MLQQPADELLARHGDGALGAGVVSAHAQQHLVAGDGYQALVADGRAVGVARQVVQHRGRTGQRRLGIDHPVVAARRAHPLGARCCRVGRIARQRTGIAGLVQRVHELAPEHL